MTDRPQHTLVVTLNRKQFKTWCDENKISIGDHYHHCVTSKLGLMGFRNVKVVTYGQYYKLPEWADMSEEIRRGKSMGYFL